MGDRDRGVSQTLRDKRRERLLKEGRNISEIIQPFQEQLERTLNASSLEEVLEPRTSGDVPVSIPRASSLDTRSESEVDQPVDFNYDRVFDKMQNGMKIRSNDFILLRVLLKFVVDLEEVQEIDPIQKAQLKDLIVSRDANVMKAAKKYHISQNLIAFRNTLKKLVSQ